MKYLIQSLIICGLLVGCGNPEVSEKNPTDLAGKKTLLQQKRQELKALNSEIDQLEQEIETLSPGVEKPRRLVTIQQVEKTDFNHFVEIQGSVQANDLISATADVSGRIIQLNVKEGQAVRKGQLVAKLDLEQLDKQIQEVEKSLELATTVFERQKRLWDQNIGSEIQFLEAKNNKERLEKSLETLRFQLDKANVYAPASGVVEQVLIQSGEIAAPGAPIFQILNTQQLKVVASVPENYLTAVNIGETIDVRFPAINKEQKARINLIGRTIDPSNRTFEIEAALNNPDRVLKPNLLAIVLVKDYSEQDAVVVPLETVQQEVSGKDFVYVKGTNDNGDFAKKVYVETGKSYKGDIIIESGLQGGEELILEGARGLAENELIRIQNTQNEAKNG
ncbi:MAG: efflux RND transporter periplasmic adaptor subunit [Saprospiraceae bacterium]|nr:efflux RND transporter periplasmic adaptor subunit [Saprospiraceae bacterium]